MAYVQTVLDSGNTLEITFSDGKIELISKEGAKINFPGSGNVIYLIDINRATYTIDYTQVSNPSVASATLLATAIQGYLDNAGVSFNGFGIRTDTDSGSTIYFNEYTDAATINLTGKTTIKKLPDMSANVLCTTLTLTGTSIDDFSPALPPNLETFTLNSYSGTSTTYPDWPVSIITISMQALPATLNSFPDFTGYINLQTFNIGNSSNFNAALGSILDLDDIAGFMVNGANLSQANADLVLSRFLDMFTANPAHGAVVINISGYTSSAPSAQGLINKGILVGTYSCTVLNN